MSNKKKQWTEAEIKFLSENRERWTAREIAEHLKRSVMSVQQRLGRLPKLEKAAEAEIPPLVAEDVSLIDYWKKEAGDAKRQLAEQSREKTAVDLLVAKAVELAPISYQPPKMARLPEKRGNGSSQSAVLMFSDCHIGQIVTADQTLNLGRYDFEIFMRRLARLEKSIFSIITEHVTTPVNELVIPMIGDLLHGALEHSVEAGQQTTLFSQFFQAGHAICQFLRNLSTIAPIRIYAAVGNHPRMPNQKKMPVANRFSNFDFFLLHYLESLLRDIPRIKFHLDAQPFAEFEVLGYRCYAGHGDSLKGGDATLGIPAHAIGRMLSNTVQNFVAAGKQFPHYYLLGHLHRSMSLPHSNGEVLTNGGWPGIDNYALMAGFNGSKPSQRFFMVHPKFGKAASYNIRLDLGDEIPHNYKIPNKFICL